MPLITIYWNIDSIIILASLIIAAYFYMTRKFNYWRNRGIVEATPIPFVGNFGKCLLRKETPQNLLKDLYESAKGEPYIGFYILDKPVLLVRDYKLLQKIFIKDFNCFYDRYASANPNDRLGYANLFFIKNPAWKILRSKLTPFFTSGKMKNMFSLMLQCAKNLEKHLDVLGLQGNGKIINVEALSVTFTANVIISIAFGIEIDPFNNPDDEFIKNGNMIFDLSIIRTIDLYATFFIPNITHKLNAHVFGKQPTIFMRKKFWEIFIDRVKSGRTRNDFIDVLIKLTKNHSDEDIDGFKFNGDDLISQAASFFTAGFHTSALPMAFTLYELAMHPEIQTRLRNDILEALESSNEDITFNTVSLDISYLDMVLSEILRMYPSLAFLNRQTMNDYKIPDTDIVIEKGTPIYISVFGLHYDPQFFPDPYTFDPERFNNKNKHNIPSCVYLPFGQGPHICIGARFAYLKIKLMLITLLSKYEVTPCKETIKPMVFDPRTLVTSPLNGVIYLNVRRIDEK